MIAVLLPQSYVLCLTIILSLFLNQARAGRRPVRDWFFEITFVRDVCMHVCVSAPEAINN